MAGLVPSIAVEEKLVNRAAPSRLLAMLLLLIAAPLAAADAPLKSIAILDFELIDDQREAAPDTVITPQLPEINRQLRAAIAEAGLYRVVDLAPAAKLIADLKATQDFLGCNGCSTDVSKQLGSDRVMVTWIHKVSNLGVNLNLQIEDGTTGERVLNKSVELRGADPHSFARGIRYLVRSMIDKGQGNR